MRYDIRINGFSSLVAFIFCLFISAAATASPTPTQFYLVSIGCGDPDNITLKAHKTIQNAQVVFCDPQMKKMFPALLADKETLPRPPIAIHKYFRAKQSGFAQGKPVKKTYKHEKAKKALDAFVSTVKAAAKSGKTVCLLEYGDPCIYGPYIWTLDVLKDLNPKVITGVSSFNTASAALQRGVTFGRAARSVILTNGADLRHGYTGADTLDRMTATRSSLVIFTMFTDFEKLMAELGKRLPQKTPVAIVVKAGYDAEERVIRGTLANIVPRVKAEGKLPFEHLIYVGDFMAD
ncbi:MAG: hypothetical protein CSA22_10140 [Deltaproteobacteria bacterium]|nr:MAG: hypothetical protein CSA22_10140 [Deltaproteobacteria bacterium]